MQTGDKTDRTHYHYDSRKDTVEKPEGTDVEVAAHFIDEVCHPEPPEDSPEENGDVTCHIMIGPELGSEETETGEQPYDEEKNQGVGECKEKTRSEILPIASVVHFRRLVIGK